MSIYISNSLYISGALGDDYNANNPVIGYHSVLLPSDITAPDSISARPAVNAWTPDTAQVWEGEGYQGVPAQYEAHLQLENSANATVNYIGIARHNFGSAQLPYTIQRSDNGGALWYDVTVERLPANNDAIIHYFDDVNSGLFRIRFRKFGSDIDAPIVGHVKLGEALVLQRRIYVGHAPASIAKKVKRSTYGSENGQYLGQVIQRTYLTTSIEQENNSPDFVREYIVPFINHVNGQVVVEDTAPSTFFFAWRPEDYPNEVVYGWTRDNISPENQGGDRLGGRMSWNCSVEAIS